MSGRLPTRAECAANMYTKGVVARDLYDAVTCDTALPQDMKSPWGVTE